MDIEYFFKLRVTEERNLFFDTKEEHIEETKVMGIIRTKTRMADCRTTYRIQKQMLNSHEIMNKINPSIYSYCMRTKVEQ
jgi:hypothetical protein